MLRLEVLPFTHEALEGRGPTLRQDLDPLQVQLADLNGGEAGGQGLGSCQLSLGNKQLLDRVIGGVGNDALEDERGRAIII